MRSLRFDTFRLDTVERTPTGALKIQATPAKAGVQVYRRADGSQVRELRHPSEVFADRSLATFAAAPVTDLHPATGAVTPTTWKSASVGHMGEQVTHDGKLVHATVYVHDDDAIRKIQAGERKELSAGYHCDLEDSPGVYEGQPYDRIQRNIVINHVSLQPPGGGRAGPECALRIDSDDAILIDDGQTVSETEPMLKIDGKDCAPEAAQAAADALVAERDRLKGALAVAQDDAKGLRAKLDAADDPKRIAAAVSARVKLLTDIRKGNAFYLRSDADAAPADDTAASSTDPIELMTEALTKWRPSLDVKGKSPDVIMGAFLAMMAAVSEPDGDETAPADGTAPTAPNTAPEMELNGISARRRSGLRGNDRVRHDSNGYPLREGDKTDADDQLSAHERQNRDNANRATQPMAASKDA
jgi:hypothetical protein